MSHRFGLADTLAEWCRSMASAWSSSDSTCSDSRSVMAHGSTNKCWTLYSFPQFLWLSEWIYIFTQYPLVFVPPIATSLNEITSILLCWHYCWLATDAHYPATKRLAPKLSLSKRSNQIAPKEKRGQGGRATVCRSPISSLDTICVVVMEKGSKKSDEETYDSLGGDWGKSWRWDPTSHSLIESPPEPSRPRIGQQ